MVLRRGDPFSDLVAIQERVNRLFEEGLSNFFHPGSETAQIGRSPKVDIYEGEKEFVIRVELPGVSEKDVQVESTNETLIIHGERKEESSEKIERYYYRERPYGPFRRTLVLPVGIERERIAANLKDGTLEVVLPKCEVTKPSQVTVSTR